MCDALLRDAFLYELLNGGTPSAHGAGCRESRAHPHAGTAVIVVPKCMYIDELFATVATTYRPCFTLNASHAMTRRYVIPAFHSPCFM